MPDASLFLKRRSLSTKLLILTIAFVLVVEMIVLIPAIANKRTEWLSARVEAAYLASMALAGDDNGNKSINANIVTQIFQTANIIGVSIKRNMEMELVLAPSIDPHSPRYFQEVDLMHESQFERLRHAWSALWSQEETLLQVKSMPRYVNGREVEIVVPEAYLRKDLRAFAWSALIASLIITSMTAAFVFWILKALIVDPVKRLTTNMSAFEHDPHSYDRIHPTTGREDEIGAAEKSLASMQTSILEHLNQQRRLATLGLGVSKISHDLRNILASAQLMSDRLTKSDDPHVKKLTPRLISALDRAIALSKDTLTFGRLSPTALQKSPVRVHELVESVFDDTLSMDIDYVNDTPEDMQVVGDRTQLYRCLFNLVKNAGDAIREHQANNTPTEQDLQSNVVPLNVGSNAGAPNSIRISTELMGDGLRVLIVDDGPGLPTHARENLFEPFKGSKKPGGTGLGLAIAAEIARAHQGELSLVNSSEKGTTFALELPERLSKPEVAA